MDFYGLIMKYKRLTEVFRFNRHQGQAMVETLVVGFVAFLLLLGIIQFGFIYNAKVILNYATFEAARAGALNHADRQAIEYALAGRLAGLYTSIEKRPGGQGFVEKAEGNFKDVEVLKDARNLVLEEDIKKKFVCIERLNPTDDAFNAYGIKGEIGTYKNQQLIPNDHLLYRSAVPRAKVSIQDANLLKLHVTYCYPMYVPLISNVIKELYDLRPGVKTKEPLQADRFRTQCLNQGRIPIVAQAVIRMQTAARNDTFAASCD